MPYKLFVKEFINVKLSGNTTNIANVLVNQ